MKIQNVSWFGILALAIAAGSARAEIACPAFVPKPFAKIETAIRADDGTILEGKKIDCKKIAIGADLIEDIQKMLKPEVATPSKLTFRMVDTYDNAFFDPTDISLNVPFQMMMGGYAKHPVHTIPVWAHEYGHAILDYQLAKLAPTWLGQIKKRATKGAGVPAEILGFMIAPYHEFFADVIAVLYTEKGESVADGLYMTGFVTNPEGKPADCPASLPGCRPSGKRKEGFKASLRNRDFTDRANQFGRWKPVAYDDIHNLLAPTRFHIWKYYLDNPEFRKEKALLAGIVVDAIMADVTRRIKRLIGPNGEITEERLEAELTDPVRANREFMKTLDAEMTRGLDLERK